MKIIQVVPKLGIKQASFVTFSISLVEEKETEKILWDLSEKKVCQKLDIPLRIIKANIDKFTKFVPSNINEAITKAFDCMPHELSVAKLSSYGFDFKALKLIYSYINNRKQRVRKNESFNEWAELLFGSPQGCIFDLCDFEEYIHIASYNDDITQYSADSNIAMQWKRISANVICC